MKKILIASGAGYVSGLSKKKKFEQYLRQHNLIEDVKIDVCTVSEAAGLQKDYDLVITSTEFSEQDFDKVIKDTAIVTGKNITETFERVCKKLQMV